jgi:flagellar hook protein FlgE
MQVNNNLNSMMQIEKRLEESAAALSKLSLNNEEAKHQEDKKDVQEQVHIKHEDPKDLDIAKELMYQIEIPIAYNANAEVISVNNSITETLLDIKA